MVVAAVVVAGPFFVVFLVPVAVVVGAVGSCSVRCSGC